jgi:endonuclease/exonuclease/phosphatase family metal-dependent hydrolase
MTFEGTELAFVRLCTFNMLARPYTKFNKALHGASGPLETADQTAARYALNMQVLEDIGPMFALLQEHDRELHPVTQLHAASSVCAFVEGRSEGCSVLAFKKHGSAGTLQHTWTLDMGEGKTAAFAFAEVNIEGVATFPLLLVSVHLKGGPDSGPVKVKQITAVLAQVLSQVPPDVPCVLAGDMNETDPAAVFVELLKEAGFKHLEPKGPTGLNSPMTVQLTIDHVYTRGLAEVKAAPMVWVPREPWGPDAVVGSDHVPVVFDIGFPVPVPASDGYSYFAV